LRSWWSLISLIKLFSPSIGNETNAVNRVLLSGTWASGAGGPKVKEFEDDLAKYTGFNNVIAVNSGTAALHLALSLMDIKGKEVILPALSFVSTANAVLYNEGIPVFADVERDTLCLDPDAVHKLVNGKTACILPVNFGGMEAKELFYDMPVICDSAHRIERHSHNDMTCYSFHPIKNLAMPTGGAIAYNGDLSKLKARRWCGITDRDGPFYDVKEIGWNYYMDEISATIGLEQLRKLDSMNAWRQHIAKEYCERLPVPHMPWNEGCSYHLFWILVEDRPTFMKKMNEAGIETGIHYKPITDFSLYDTCPRNYLPITEEIKDKIVSIPMHPGLTTADVDKIISTISSLV